MEKEVNRQNERVLGTAELESRQINGDFRFFEAT
jgi:hypothetical protein